MYQVQSYIVEGMSAPKKYELLDEISFLMENIQAENSIVCEPHRCKRFIYAITGKKGAAQRQLTMDSYEAAKNIVEIQRIIITDIVQMKEDLANIVSDQAANSLIMTFMLQTMTEIMVQLEKNQIGDFTAKILQCNELLKSMLNGNLSAATSDAANAPKKKTKKKSLTESTVPKKNGTDLKHAMYYREIVDLKRKLEDHPNRYSLKYIGDEDALIELDIVYCEIGNMGSWSSQSWEQILRQQDKIIIPLLQSRFGMSWKDNVSDIISVCMNDIESLYDSLIRLFNESCPLEISVMKAYLDIFDRQSFGTEDVKKMIQLYTKMSGIYKEIRSTMKHMAEAQNQLVYMLSGKKGDISLPFYYNRERSIERTSTAQKSGTAIERLLDSVFGGFFR